MMMLSKFRCDYRVMRCVSLPAVRRMERKTAVGPFVEERLVIGGFVFSEYEWLW